MRLYKQLFTFALFCFVTNVQAEELVIPYHGLNLSAELELVAGKHLTDGVVLITHGSLGHRDMETITSQRALLKERGYNTLAINLSLGLDHRLGTYDCKNIHRHRNEDAVGEIGAWVDWLVGKGVNQITLFGHSRGAAQTALYAAQHDDPRVKAVVLLAPPTAENAGEGYQRRYGTALAPLLEQAEQLVRAGRGETVLEHVNIMYCRDVSASANSFVSYYRSSPDLDSPGLLPRIKVPTLVIAASEDEVVAGLDKIIPPLLGNNPQVRFKVIQGAGHFFRDLNAEDAADTIDEFLASINIQTSSIPPIYNQENNDETKDNYCM